MKSQVSYQSSREHHRFKANHRALVLYPISKEAFPYHLIDISRGGFSFRYLGKKLNHSKTEKISLYFEHELIVDSIPVEPVSDYRLGDNLIPVRRRSFRFSGLNDEQQGKLEVFIQKYTEVTH